MSTEHGLSIASFDNIRLAFPLSEVVGIRRGTELETDAKLDIALSIGNLIHANRHWPVFRLNADFMPVNHLASQHDYCLCLSADNSQTGIVLACDAVATWAFNDDQTSPSSLQNCMQRAVTPLLQLTLYKQQLLPVSSAPALATYLRALAA